MESSGDASNATASGLSFNEFSAVRRRKAAQHERVEAQEAYIKGNSEDETHTAGGLEKNSSRGDLFGRLGTVLQSQELQLVMVILIVMDFLSGFYQLYATAMKWDSAFLQILEYQSGVSLLFSTLEISLVLLAFKGAMFTHFGYSLDLIVVFTMLYTVVASDAQMAATARLLNVLRLWRIVRMINVTVIAVEQAHMATKAALTTQQDLVDGLKLRIRKAELTNKRESDKYKRLEQSFRAQRDELETLREALHIAAQTVAQVQGYDAISNLVSGEQQDDMMKKKTTFPQRRLGDEESDFEDPLSDMEETKQSLALA